GVHRPDVALDEPHVTVHGPLELRRAEHPRGLRVGPLERGVALGRAVVVEEPEVRGLAHRHGADALDEPRVAGVLVAELHEPVEGVLLGRDEAVEARRRVVNGLILLAKSRTWHKSVAHRYTRLHRRVGALPDVAYTQDG